MVGSCSSCFVYKASVKEVLYLRTLNCPAFLLHSQCILPLSFSPFSAKIKRYTARTSRTCCANKIKEEKRGKNMVIVLKKVITNEEKQHLGECLAQENFKRNDVVGEEETSVAAVGKLAMDPREVEILPGVSRVIPISKPYKMASREFKRDNTIVEIPNSRGQIIRVGGQRVVSIAGPCAVESAEQMMTIAASVAASGAVMLRGGAYKPRTSPYSFQGLGEEGLKYLKAAGEKYGLPVVTEIVSTDFIPVMKDYVDVYQVGARNMQNFELLKKLGALGKPVILKNGLSATIEELLMSAEYLLSSGTDKVILCIRGIRTYEKATRNTLDLSRSEEH